MLKVRYKSNKSMLKLYAQSADQSGLTNLTNIGVQTQKFAKDFNDYTKGLPEYLQVMVLVEAVDSKTYKYKVSKPSTGHLLYLCKFEKIIKVWSFDRWNEENIECILLEDVLLICKFKFPFLSLQESFFIVYGTVKSMKLKLLYNK